MPFWCPGLSVETRCGVDLYSASCRRPT